MFRMVIQAYIFLNEKLEPHLSLEEKSVKYNLSIQKEASKYASNDAPAPLCLLPSSNRPIAPAPAQPFQTVQNITQNRKRSIADKTGKDAVKITKQDPEDEPLSMLGQSQEDDSFFVESTDEPAIARVSACLRGLKAKNRKIFVKA